MGMTTEMRIVFVALGLILAELSGIQRRLGEPRWMYFPTLLTGALLIVLSFTR